MTPRAKRQLYLREAAIMLAIARLAIRFASPARIFAWADRPRRRVRRFADDEASWIAWAVEHTAALPGMETLCLPRAIAAHAMLRRRGIASKLCLGVARNGGELAAHAWVEVGDAKILGGGAAFGFTRLAAFGAE